MCNFVPGECLAIARADVLRNELPSWQIPGRLIFLPVCYEDKSLTDEIFGEYEIVRVVDIPDCLEILVASKLSAALASEIGDHRSVVELNYIMPLSICGINHYEHWLKLSPPANRTAQNIREWCDSSFPNGLGGLIGVLDSGVNRQQIRTERHLSAYDYAGDSAISLFDQASLDSDVPNHDNLGHGTRVIRILDEVVSLGVGIVSGRISARENYVSVLRVARAYAHLVSKEKPRS